MTPAARIAAAIDILDQIGGGQAAEQVLTHWARSNRYAGSGDRAAIRDHVFDALRCRRSYAWLGGSDTGRGLMIGALRAEGADPAALFTGEGYAPAVLGPEEAVVRSLEEAPDAIRLDCQDWLLPVFRASLGDRAEAVLTALQSRAPVFLRVNLRKATPGEAMAELAGSGITARPHPLSPTALEVTDGARRVQRCPAYTEGRIELQDAASQAIMDLVPLKPGDRVLDFCAGGGGKSLALAARQDLRITAHDANPQRMKDLPLRAARAGVEVTIAGDREKLRGTGYDVVLCDVPCSGSGAWRRSAEAKWTLTPDGLSGLLDVQGRILDETCGLVGDGGVLAYATCSLFAAENRDQIDRFLQRVPGWSLWLEKRLTPLDGADGFYLALLTRASLQE